MCVESYSFLYEYYQLCFVRYYLIWVRCQRYSKGGWICELIPAIQILLVRLAFRFHIGANEHVHAYPVHNSLKTCVSDFQAYWNHSSISGLFDPQLRCHVVSNGDDHVAGVR